MKPPSTFFGIPKHPLLSHQCKLNIVDMSYIIFLPLPEMVEHKHIVAKPHCPFASPHHLELSSKHPLHPNNALSFFASLPFGCL